MGRDVPVTGVLLSIWRAAVLYRVITLALSLYLIVRWHNLYAVPGVAYGVAAAMVVVTAVVATLGTTGRAHRVDLVAADAVATVALTLLSRAAQHPAQFHGGMPTLTTIWAAGPAIEAGLVLGTAAGALAGVVQFAASVIARGGYDGRTLLNGVLLLLVGGLAGYITTRAVDAEQQRAEVAAERARLTERERLTRSIHDGVLQVLGLVHRRGLAAGGEWAELAREAAAQEAALRALITTSVMAPAATGAHNVAADLVRLRSDRVVVSVPDTPVLLPDDRAVELREAVRAVLHNVDQHAGDGATAWVLLEALQDELVLTVRDDGVGIANGRLEEAAAQGRLGVVTSIRGRIVDLGGTVTITSAPGQGTEVEIVVPL